MNRQFPLGSLLAVSLLSAGACLVPRAPGQSDAAFERTRAREACVAEAKRLGYDVVEVLGTSEEREEGIVGWIIFVDLRIRKDRTEEVTCTYNTMTRSAHIPA